mmetsp:Transcript_1130/g.1570  ORF Transcript_1130/g.1570 Transcript_1130/m.1570 type:complete len:985 (-) Transcript_1130:332-3286(-)|eukprot:jgi/Bigna1/51478/estExt_Genewise1Plus.C_10189
MVYTANSQGTCIDHLVRRFRITLINRPKAVVLGGLVLLGMLFFTARSPNVPSVTVPGAAATSLIQKPGVVSTQAGKTTKSDNIFVDTTVGHEGLQKKERYQSIGQKGATLWFTGFSGSGKSTIGKKLEEVLVRDYRKHVYRLDGDNLRFGINSDLGFSKEDRTENVRRVGEISKLFAESGVIVVASLISPYRADRDKVRKIHEESKNEFLEVFVDVPIESAEARDPKGLYKKARSGQIKGFTGLDAPYEAPRNPEIRLPSHQMTLDEEVRAIILELQRRGILTASENTPAWYPALLPPDGGMHWEPPSYSTYSAAAAAKFPPVLLNDIDLQFVQCIGEGWAAPLKGFMREGVLLQTLHFNSMLTDPNDLTGNAEFPQRRTNFDDYSTKLQMGERVDMSIPIVLPITAATKKLIGSSRQVTLTAPTGKAVAVLTDPEIYNYRKEEVISRVFGGMDPDHPYIKVMMASGPYLLGGEIELLERIRYNDGLDQYRLTPKELRERFIAAGTDAVYAFQTRNPTHAGHAYLMQDAGRQLKAMGYKKPLLWLTPLGGWTKPDDMPLDVRIHQHQVIIEEGMLPSDTVMAIWPSPMLYAGPTEVQWHCKSRRNVGARFFITGRDPAGIKRSKNKNQMTVGGDFYDGNHGRYVLQTSPGLGEQKILSFAKVVYDKKDNKMKPPDKNRKSDFLSISGSTMRALAKKGAPPCPDAIADNWEETKPCIPNGFMVKRGWELMIQYYQDPKNQQWIGYSRMMSEPLIAPGNFVKKGTFGKPSWTLYFQNKEGENISPWHDLQLYPSGADASGRIVNMMVEIPMGRMEKLEVNKEEKHNPIKQDVKKNKPRYYKYGVPFFNYGMLPQTWEDPAKKDKDGHMGDGDPLDVMEIGSKQLPTGTVVQVKVLGVYALIDQGEVDYKIIVINKDDPMASTMRTPDDIDGLVTERLADWLKMYKTAEGKEVNELTNDVMEGPLKAMSIIKETNDHWKNGREAGTI